MWYLCMTITNDFIFFYISETEEVFTIISKPGLRQLKFIYSSLLKNSLL